MTSTAVSVGSIEDELDKKREQLNAVLRDSRQATKHLDAFKALNELNQIDAALERARMMARSEAFQTIAGALDESSAALGRNAFQDALADLRTHVQNALGSARGRRPTPPTPADELEEQVESTIDEASEKDEVTPVDTESAGNVIVTGRATKQQKAVIAGIVAAAQSQGVSEDLLGAIGWIESRLRNVKSANSSARGPFQFLPSTWNGMVRNFGVQLNITEADINNVDKQAIMAAVAFKGYRRTLERANIHLRRPMLYLCHLLGSSAAKACLSANPSVPINEPLENFYSGTPHGAGFAKKIMDGNSGILKDSDGDSRSVESVLGRIKDLLDRGEGKYHQLKGSALQPAPAKAIPKWFQIAQGELDKGVSEIPGRQHDPSIVAYLATTTLPDNLLKDETHWCSAFVNWCVTKAGLEGTNNAMARSWENFGDVVDQPRLGDIVVFWRVSRSSGKGHVGFYMQQDASTITILGGNQNLDTGGDGVSVKAMSRTQLLGIRRPPNP